MAEQTEAKTLAWAQARYPDIEWLRLTTMPRKTVEPLNPFIGGQSIRFAGRETYEDVQVKGNHFERFGPSHEQMAGFDLTSFKTAVIGGYWMGHPVLLHGAWAKAVDSDFNQDFTTTFGYDYFEVLEIT